MIYFPTIANIIKSKYRTTVLYDGPVTFREFVQYIIDPKTEQPLNWHWQPIHQLCQPCRVNYDFIGHYETLDQDTRYVRSKLGINVNQFPRERVYHNSSDRVFEMFAQLTESQIHRLVEVYRLDFIIFGYAANILTQHDVGLSVSQHVSTQ